MKQYRINKITIKLIKTTLALILGVFITYSINNEAFATNYSVTYHDNFVSNMPVDESASTLSSSVTLPATTPTRDGFQFKGWCTALTADGGTCSGTSYAAGGTYTINQVASNNLTLYAVWEPPLYMQDATSADCGKTMIDSRDGEEYTTATIDNICWMTKNLNLGDNSSMLLTSSDTNIAASTYNLPASSTNGFSDSAVQSIYKSNSTDCSSAVGCYAYYNYAAATAGTNPSTGDSTSDICPAGWRLPKNTELYSLSTGKGAEFVAAPFLGVRAGNYYRGSFSEGNAQGVYWSSTATSSSYAYTVTCDGDFDDTYTGTDYKPIGYSIRCLLSD